MNQFTALLILIIIIIIIFYWLKKHNNNLIDKKSEYFTILKKIQNPDIPHKIQSKNETARQNIKSNIKSKKKIGKMSNKKSWNNDNFSNDEFISVCGSKVRKQLVPSNYADKIYSNVDFIENDIIIDAPQAYNMYIDY